MGGWLERRRNLAGVGGWWAAEEKFVLRFDLRRNGTRRFSFFGRFSSFSAALSSSFCILSVSVVDERCVISEWIFRHIFLRRVAVINFRRFFCVSSTVRSFSFVLVRFRRDVCANCVWVLIMGWMKLRHHMVRCDPVVHVFRVLHFCIDVSKTKGNNCCSKGGCAAQPPILGWRWMAGQDFVNYLSWL